MQAGGAAEGGGQPLDDLASPRHRKRRASVVSVNSDMNELALGVEQDGATLGSFLAAASREATAAAAMAAADSAAAEAAGATSFSGYVV